jgi:methyl-accepting chemotaxis protein
MTESQSIVTSASGFSEEQITGNPVGISDLGLPDNDVNQLKNLFGITQEDERRISELDSLMKECVETVVEDFYLNLLDLPKTKEFFHEQSVLDEAKRRQRVYLEQMTAGSYGRSYVEFLLQSGQMNRQIDMPITWYVGGFCYFLQALTTELEQSKDARQVLDLVLSLNKMLFFDLAVTLESSRIVGNRQSQLSSLPPTNFAGELETARNGGEVPQLLNVLAQAATRITTVANQLSSSTTQTLATVSEATSTAEEVRQVSEQTNAKSKAISDDARNVVEVSREGQAATDATLGGMVRIREQMESIGECMEQLNNQSKLIADIIATVDDLAQQSNLLAVNASIEAAKAGVQGKGFGVVAREVKNLSKQSKVATANVRKILNDIVKATNDATIAAERGSSAVDAGHRQASGAGEVIRTLTTSIANAAEATQLIEVASQQQLVGMKQMVQAMEHIKQSSEMNSSFAVELEKSSRELTGLGQKLLDLSRDSK